MDAHVVSVPAIPIVTIFVRHSASCPHQEDHFYKACKCRKSLRWFYGGKQKTQSARTRSWALAEKAKRKLEDKLKTMAGVHGAVRVEAESRKSLEQAVQLFLMSKRNEGLSEEVLKKYERELERLSDFLAQRSKLFPEEITGEDLTVFQSSWGKLYPSSHTRSRVVTRYRAFLRYCMDSGWITRAPKFSKVKIDETPTLPLSDSEYAKLLEAIQNEFSPEKAKKVRALVQLMRYSGLAIRDAVTLERAELLWNEEKGIHRVVTKRTKTGVDVSVPIPNEIAAEINAVVNENPRYLFWNTGTGKEQSAVTNWQHDLRQVFRAAGFPEGHPHQLRDTFAVALLEKGVPLEEVSKLLGHESVRTTEKHYAPWVKARQDRLDALVIATWA